MTLNEIKQLGFIKDQEITEVDLYVDNRFGIYFWSEEYAQDQWGICCYNDRLMFKTVKAFMDFMGMLIREDVSVAH